MTNDKGYVPLHDVARDLRGVVFPLSGLVAVLMVVEVAQQGDDYEQSPLVERTLNPTGMQIINHAAWDTVASVLDRPPRRRPAITTLTAGDKTARMPNLGPYRGNREPGMFDWACPGLGDPSGLPPSPDLRRKS